LAGAVLDFRIHTFKGKEEGNTGKGEKVGGIGRREKGKEKKKKQEGKRRKGEGRRAPFPNLHFWLRHCLPAPTTLGE